MLLGLHVAHDDAVHAARGQRLALGGTEVADLHADLLHVGLVGDDDDLKRFLLVAREAEFDAGGHGDVRHAGAGRIFSMEDAKPTTRPFAAGRVGLDLRPDGLKLGADSHLALQARRVLATRALRRSPTVRTAGTGLADHGLVRAQLVDEIRHANIGPGAEIRGVRQGSEDRLTGIGEGVVEGGEVGSLDLREGPEVFGGGCREGFSGLKQHDVVHVQGHLAGRSFGEDVHDANVGGVEPLGLQVSNGHDLLHVGEGREACLAQQPVAGGVLAVADEDAETLVGRARDWSRRRPGGRRPDQSVMGGLHSKAGHSAKPGFHWGRLKTRECAPEVAKPAASEISLGAVSGSPS